jgi:hypothetical protein
MTDHLKTFLSGFRDSRNREYVLATRLVHDLAVAAAGSGYNLLVYLPTVDGDGFDVIFDDRDRLVAIQLKSVVTGGKLRVGKSDALCCGQNQRKRIFLGLSLRPVGQDEGEA